jgi:hypothetical protein
LDKYQLGLTEIFSVLTCWHSWRILEQRSQSLRHCDPKESESQVLSPQVFGGRKSDPPCCETNRGNLGHRWAVDKLLALTNTALHTHPPLYLPPPPTPHSLHTQLTFPRSQCVARVENQTTRSSASASATSSSTDQLLPSRLLWNWKNWHDPVLHT